MSGQTDRVVGIGEVSLQQIGVGPRSREALVELTQLSVQTGGAIGTALATVCALGGQARYFGRVSDDEFGVIIVRGLRDFGVETAFVLTEPDKTSPVSFTLVDERTPHRLVRFSRGNISEPAKLKEVMARESLSWRSFVDTGAITAAWNAPGTPSYYVIDHRGMIRHKWVGNPGAKTIDAALEKLILEVKP